MFNPDSELFWIFKFGIGGAEVVAGIVLISMSFGDSLRWGPVPMFFGLPLLFGGMLTAIAQ